MGLYHPVSTKGSCAVAICDRCRIRMSANELRPDGNSPGLMVCKDCWDVKDPWRLPVRPTEVINTRYPRPDVPLISPVVWVNTSGMVIIWENELNQQIDWIPI